MKVVVVGTGVAGTVFARRVLEADGDHRVVMLEAGPAVEFDRYRMWLDRLMAGANPYERFWEPPRRENDRFGLRGSRLFARGGTTHHWGGWSLRFKPEDFELHARTGRGADWPIDYQELAPFYTVAEHLLGIEGDSDSDDPPRFGDRFPFPPAPYTLNDMPLIETFERLGMSYGHMPMARNADRCVTTGTCRICPVNARYTADYDLAQLEREHPGRLTVKTGHPGTAIELASKTEALGVRYLDVATGQSGLEEGDRVVICNGTVESAKLLLASTGQEWPRGLGNDSDHVGRHLVGHPLIFAEGIRPGNPERAHQELGFITLACRHYDTPEYQRDGKMLFARVGDDSMMSIEREILGGTPRPRIEEKLKEGLHLAFECSVEQFESPENRIDLGGETAQPGLRETIIEFGVDEVTQKALQTHADHLVEVLRAAGCSEESTRFFLIKPDGAHAVATCRMSADEADGVVDADLRVHGTDNVHLCSNGVFPNVTAVNPTLTVAALAARLGDHLGGMS